MRARSCDERVAGDAELNTGLVEPPAALDWRALGDPGAEMQELCRSVVGDEEEAAALVGASGGVDVYAKMLQVLSVGRNWVVMCDTF